MARYFGTNIVSADVNGLTPSQYAAINSGITSNLVNELETNVVHKSGGETITGNKTFTNLLSRTGDFTSDVITYTTSDTNSDSYIENHGLYSNNAIYNRQVSYNAISKITGTLDLLSQDNGVVSAYLNTNGTELGNNLASSATSDNALALRGWVNDPTKSTNVVHRSGNETIEGTKTTTGNIILKDTSNAIGTFSTDAWAANQVQFIDKNDNRTGRIQVKHVTGTNILETGMYASNGITTEQGIRIRSNGDAYAPIPPASSSTSNANIATTGWVNDPTKSTNVVHRSGEETITSTKTWEKSDIIIYQNNTDMDITVAPSKILYGGIQFNDKNGKRMGKIETCNTTDTLKGYVEFGMNSTRFFDVDGTSTPYYSQLKLYIDDNKVTHCSLPQEVHATNFHGTADYAKWADLAECYKPDQKYLVGTLIKFGGEKDITIAKDKCNGVISDKPGFILDAELEDSQPVALVGKTPIRIIGKVNKFDNITLSEIPGIGRIAEEGEKIIAKALENSDNEKEKLVLCVTKFNLD